MCSEEIKDLIKDLIAVPVYSVPGILSAHSVYDSRIIYLCYGFDCKLFNCYLQSCYVRQKSTTL